jgi:hypothetical protein
MSKPKDDSFDKSRLKQIKPYKTPSIIKNQNLRIIQKNLVYVIGLSSNIANTEVIFIIILDPHETRVFWTVWINYQACC